MSNETDRANCAAVARMLRRIADALEDGSIDEVFIEIDHETRRVESDIYAGVLVREPTGRFSMTISRLDWARFSDHAGIESQGNGRITDNGQKSAE